MNAKIFAWVIMFSGICGLSRFEARALTNEVSVTAKSAYERLLEVRVFAFGGVGIAGRASEGEIAYRAICRLTNARELFLSAFTNGTMEARVYALCGIKRFSTNDFARCVNLLETREHKVRTMSGCIILDLPVSSVVAKIKSEDFHSIP